MITNGPGRRSALQVALLLMGLTLSGTAPLAQPDGPFDQANRPDRPDRPNRPSDTDRGSGPRDAPKLDLRDLNYSDPIGLLSFNEKGVKSIDFGAFLELRRLPSLTLGWGARIEFESTDKFSIGPSYGLSWFANVSAVIARDESGFGAKLGAEAFGVSYDATPEDLWDYFGERARSELHSIFERDIEQTAIP